MDVRLRRFEDGDAEAFVQAVRESLTTVGRWMPWCRPDYAVEDAFQWFSACRDGTTRRRAFEYGIYTPDGERLLGGVGINQIDWALQRCNLGYWVREPIQRQGIASAAAAALAHHAFLDLDLQRIEIVAAVGNTASAGVAEKLGAKFEGVARNRLILQGKAVSAWVYSLIPADMRASRCNLLPAASRFDLISSNH